MGWTGDTQVFVNTACYNMDSYIFYKKYMNDLRGDQILYYKGDIPSISPSLKHQLNNGGAGWADAELRWHLQRRAECGPLHGNHNLEKPWIGRCDVRFDAHKLGGRPWRMGE